MADQAGRESIEIEGFLSIRSASVRLRQLNVLVGANGAGKSNFVRAFELLGRLVDEELGLFVGLNGGASTLLNDGGERRIRIRANGDPNSYEAILIPAANDELIFGDERGYYRTLRHPEPYEQHFGSGHRETRSHEQARSRPNRVASYVLDLLRGCRVYHFHDTSVDAPVKRMVPTADNLALRNDAGNLASVLLRLRDSGDPAEQAAYRRINGNIRQIAPFFRDFVLDPDERSDRIRLKWNQVGSDAIFSAQQLSDGTLRFMCLATLLLHPRLPAVVVLDEPELGLHPYAITR
jgi:predicted ATPase